MIVFACPSCGVSLSAGDSQTGAPVRCPRCYADVRVPAPTAEPPHPNSLPPTVTAPNPVPFPRPSGPARSYGFNCPFCSSRLEATTDRGGQAGQCPTCGSDIVIPIQDRYGRLIDPLTREIIKPDPHPVHAYAAAGERAPRIIRDDAGLQSILCSRCSSLNPITANNCRQCGLPFTLEGTEPQAAGGGNGYCVASLVLGILSLPLGVTVVAPVLAVIFGLIGLHQTSRAGSTQGRGMAIAGLACGTIGGLLALMMILK